MFRGCFVKCYETQSYKILSKFKKDEVTITPDFL
nr:MAG TPA: hypothetical protein [Bacteriophage sp.]